MNAPINDAVHEQLCARLEELEHEKATLAEQLDAAETRLAAMTRGVRRAREWGGDNLPAATGLTMITMLEKAMRGVSDG